LPGENLLEEFVRPLGLSINALARAITAVRRGLRMITL
jgi:plasmid maintenance system antidote protein VapI